MNDCGCQSPLPALDSDAAPADDLLLAQFVATRDELAYRQLVARHARLVLGVCRRVLVDHHDAEEAFQATFLVLAQKASRVRIERTLAPWLYGVAYRISLRAAQKRSRRREEPLAGQVMVGRSALEDVAAHYERQVLDEELNGLPEQLREPLVLHYLMGQTNKEVAAQLNLTVRTVEGRQRRGKTLLRRRLALRKVSLPLAVTALAASNQTLTAAAIEPLVDVTATAALKIAAGQPVTDFSTNTIHWGQTEAMAMGSSITPAAMIVGATLTFASTLGFLGQFAGPGGDGQMATLMLQSAVAAQVAGAADSSATEATEPVVDVGQQADSTARNDGESDVDNEMPVDDYVYLGDGDAAVDAFGNPIVITPVFGSTVTDITGETSSTPLALVAEARDGPLQLGANEYVLAQDPGADGNRRSPEAEVQQLRAELYRQETLVLDTRRELMEIEVAARVALRQTTTENPIYEPIILNNELDLRLQHYMQQQIETELRLQKLHSQLGDPNAASIKEAETQLQTLKAQFDLRLEQLIGDLKQQHKNMPSEMLKSIIAEKHIRQAAATQRLREHQAKIAGIKAQLVKLGVSATDADDPFGEEITEAPAAGTFDEAADPFGNEFEAAETADSFSESGESFDEVSDADPNADSLDDDQLILEEEMLIEPDDADVFEDAFDGGQPAFEDTIVDESVDVIDELHPDQEDAFELSEGNPNDGPSGGVVDVSGMSPSEKRIKAALAGQLRSPLELYDMPLNEIVSVISTDYDIPMILDTAALQAEAISPDTAIDVPRLSDISLGAALRHMLRPLNHLTYIIQDEMLVITSKEEAESQLTTRVYDVRGIGINASDIVEKMPKVVCYRSWQDNDQGEGQVTAIGDNVIAVMQSQHVHEEVVDFLEQLGRVNTLHEGEGGGFF